MSTYEWKDACEECANVAARIDFESADRVLKMAQRLNEGRGHAEDIEKIHDLFKKAREIFGK